NQTTPLGELAVDGVLVDGKSFAGLLEELTARFRAFVQQEHIESGARGSGRGRESCGPGADDQYIGATFAPRSVTGGGGCSAVDRGTRGCATNLQIRLRGFETGAPRFAVDAHLAFTADAHTAERAA